MYEERKKDDVLFYEGDSGKKFFIIIDGEVEFLKEQKKSKGN
jgi:CRP-like cAMP-binding protein